MMFLYLGALLFSIAGMLTLDWRYKLAFWFDVKRTAFTLIAAIGVFLVWDFFGIALGIFFSGHSPYMLDVYLAPELPPEEFVFLFLLTYVTLVIYRGLQKWQRI